MTPLDPNILGDYGNESFLPKSRGSGPQAIRCGLSASRKLTRTLDDWDRVRYERTSSGVVLIYDGQRFMRRGAYGDTIYWACVKKRMHCSVYMITNKHKPTQVAISGVHNHV
ncbi:hypothetical protein KR222_000129 [Zaprionus bogoriensis]|nr:hypothetical protein KR222_000129 [Zaprionus bogoriensis]